MPARATPDRDGDCKAEYLHTASRPSRANLAELFDLTDWNARPDPGQRAMPRLYAPSREVLSEVLVHLEHRRLVLAEHRLQLGVGQNLATVLRVL
jgi:hypothetical protein